jgi:hypothetical protein
MKGGRVDADPQWGLAPRADEGISSRGDASETDPVQLLVVA